jgi:DNA-directed RNA polymerase subunit RPC12/RpoP
MTDPITTRPAVCPTCGWPPIVSVAVKRAGDVQCPTCGYRRTTYTADEGTSGFLAYTPEQVGVTPRDLIAAPDNCPHTWCAYYDKDAEEMCAMETDGCGEPTGTCPEDEWGATVCDFISTKQAALDQAERVVQERDALREAVSAFVSAWDASERAREYRREVRGEEMHGQVISAQFKWEMDEDVRQKHHAEMAVLDSLRAALTDTDKPKEGRDA